MRSVKKAIQRAVERTLHLRVYSTRPHGRDDCHDLQASGVPIVTILDVGANDGGSALKFHDAFPDAVIHCFEPVAGMFATLVANVARIPLIRCHQLAAGDAPGEASIFLTHHSTTSSLIRPEHPRGEERVRVTTVDLFAADQGIRTVDLLKIDTEGYDLQVLRGAAGLLGRGAVKFVLTEVGFHPDDARHTLFDDVRDFLLAKGFRVYGIYDQQLEWSGENRLRYANVCFAHESVAQRRRASTSSATSAASATAVDTQNDRGR